MSPLAHVAIWTARMIFGPSANSINRLCAFTDYASCVSRFKSTNNSFKNLPPRTLLIEFQFTFASSLFGVSTDACDCPLPSLQSPKFRQRSDSKRYSSGNVSPLLHEFWSPVSGRTALRRSEVIRTESKTPSGVSKDRCRTIRRANADGLPSRFWITFNTRSRRCFENNRQNDRTLLWLPNGIGWCGHGAVLRLVSDSVWHGCSQIRNGHSNIHAHSWTDSAGWTRQSADLVWLFQPQPNSHVSSGSQDRQINH